MTDAMSGKRKFAGFLSYAHHDAKTDPVIIPAFTSDLENRVNTKLLNAHLTIWRDKAGIRTGEIWNAEIERELRAASVLIVLLTPKWIDSDYCRKEYEIFEEAEADRKIGQYVAPILVRTIQRQEKHLTASQRVVYERIRARQYANAIDLLSMTKKRRDLLVETIADDVVGMIERLREAPAPSQRGSNRATIRPRSAVEFDFKAQDYEKVDFITDGEVVLDRANNATLMRNGRDRRSGKPANVPREQRGAC